MRRKSYARISRRVLTHSAEGKPEDTSINRVVGVSSDIVGNGTYAGCYSALLVVGRM